MIYDILIKLLKNIINAFDHGFCVRACERICVCRFEFALAV